MRFCIHANTHGIARNDSTALVPLRDGGREPMFSCESSAIGAISLKKRMNSGSSYTSAR